MNNDRTVIHLVVIFIGLIAFTLAAGLLILNYQGKQIDALLATLAGGAVGALTALLASTRGGPSKDDAQPVTVTNGPAEPVPTADVAPGRHQAPADLSEVPL